MKMKSRNICFPAIIAILLLLLNGMKDDQRITCGAGGLLLDNQQELYQNELSLLKPNNICIMKRKEFLQKGLANGTIIGSSSWVAGSDDSLQKTQDKRVPRGYDV